MNPTKTLRTTAPPLRCISCFFHEQQPQKMDAPVTPGGTFYCMHGDQDGPYRRIDINAAKRPDWCPRAVYSEALEAVIRKVAPDD